MHGTLIQQEQRLLVAKIVIALLAILVIVMAIITCWLNYSNLVNQSAISSIESELIAVKREAANTKEQLSSLTNSFYSAKDMELYGFSTDDLFYLSSRNGINYYKLKSTEKTEYWHYGYVDEEYAKNREIEWIAALKEAIQTKDDLRESLRDALSYEYPWPELERTSDGKLTDEGLNYFLDRLKVLPTGEIYCYDSADSFYDTDIYLRANVCDPEEEQDWGIYCFFPAISY